MENKKQITILSDFLSNKIKEKGWNKREFAEKTGLHETYVYRLLSSKRDFTPTDETLEKIAKVLELSNENRLYILDLARRERETGILIYPDSIEVPPEEPGTTPETPSPDGPPAEPQPDNPTNPAQDTYLTNVYEKFKQDKFLLTDGKINDLNVIVASKKEFRLSWFATQMNIFSIMAGLNNISKDVIENFSKNAIDYAIKNNKGLPRGLQSCVTSFGLLASLSIDEEAKHFVREGHKKHFAAFELPVLFDLKNEELVYCKKPLLWGAIYYDFFMDFIKKYFVA